MSSGETKTYTELEMIQFGYYLLSDERTKFVKDNTKGNHKNKVTALKQVYDLDLNHFNFLLEQSKTKQA